MLIAESAPKDLGPDSFDVVRSRMVRKPPHHISMTGLITITRGSIMHRKSFPELRESLGSFPSLVDMSFSSQMKSIFNRQIKWEGYTLPDAFLFTAYSAIPVAATVRAFYDEKGVEQPAMGSIKTRPDGVERPLRLTGDETHHTFGELAPENIAVEGQNVCLIDQYVSGGITIARAASFLLHTAGVEQLDIIRGQWYQDAHAVQPNIETLSSQLDTYMRMIGR
jgi:phosphoribosylpyrophosphate synthetase